MNPNTPIDPEYISVDTPENKFMSYYLFTKGKLKKVEREPPEHHYSKFSEEKDNFQYLKALRECSEWSAYLRQITPFEVSPELSKLWKEGQHLQEGEGFEIEDQFWNGSDWWPTKHLVNRTAKPGTKLRSIAIPIPKAPKSVSDITNEQATAEIKRLREKLGMPISEECNYGWISVKDGLPPRNDKYYYWLYSESLDNYEMGDYDHNVGIFKDQSGMRLLTVSHWMLPVPPNKLSIPTAEKETTPVKWVKADKPLREYPIGTKAKALGGGYWERVGLGWKWCTGAAFPNVGGDWTGQISLPESLIPAEKEESQDDLWDEIEKKLDEEVSMAEHYGFAASTFLNEIRTKYRIVITRIKQ